MLSGMHCFSAAVPYETHVYAAGIGKTKMKSGFMQ